jgi:5-methylcytosine-specific restriction endonuclease McrA
MLKRTPIRKESRKQRLKQAKLAELPRPLFCTKCGKERKLDPHHIKLRSRGRDDSPENIEWLCRSCHIKEGSQVQLNWIKEE